ncbi:condensation domain-containing protein [Planotetraspora phitsanulokensis]|uniref:condensation domain-containing protein n=1 Tax=Planotetraspora phitsanulokensis TaxID=575192 RepID=UPI0019503DB3|nr:condensation domain-containing protein [Planotetraspora phitsanulokensis]
MFRAADLEWTGPLAWGQRSIWEAMRLVGVPGDRYFNFTRTVTVPRAAGSPGPDTVARALAMVVERHDSLRTRVRIGSDGEPYQVVGVSGGIEARVGADLDAEAVAEERFDPAGDWPVRAGLVTRDGVVEQVILAFCHTAADGYAGDIVARDLRVALLRGAPPGGPEQLRDLVGRQEGHDAARGERSVAFWERGMAELGGPVFEQPRREPSAEPRYQRLTMVSPALDRASQTLSARYGVSTSTVLLAAACVEAARVAGRPVAAMTPLVNNRFRRQDRDLVTSLAQLGLFVLPSRNGGGRDAGGRAGFHELMVSARAAALRAYRHAYYDQAELNRRLDGADPLCCFNDQRPVEAVTPVGEVPGDAEIGAALPLTEIVPESGLDELNCRFCVHVTGVPDRLSVLVTADSRHVAPRDLESFLRGMEALVVGGV